MISRGWFLFLVFLPLLFKPSAAADEKPELSLSEVESSIVAICHTAPSLNNRTGTGFIASSDGVVVTADHVVTDSHGRAYERVFCLRPTYPNHEIYELVLLKRFRERRNGRDLALLKIKDIDSGRKFAFLPIGGHVAPGQSVLTAGFPTVFKGIYLWPLFRRGSVSSIRYRYENSEVMVLDLKVLQGYSGAPVIDEKDYRVLGVIKGKNTLSSDGDFSVATPIEAEDLLQK